MTNYSGNLVNCAAVRGRVGILAINSLSSSTTDLCNIAPIDPQTLAARWMISPDCAKNTVVMTTQRGVRTCLNPTLSCRFPTNDRMLRYKRLPHTIFTDTMFASTTSRPETKWHRFTPHPLDGSVRIR